MDAKIGRRSSTPWAPSSPAPLDYSGCEREVAEAATEEHKKEGIMRLSWALVHSRNQHDVLRGIADTTSTMHGATTSPWQAREKLYLLAVGHYRNGDYIRSRQFPDHCLELVASSITSLDLASISVLDAKVPADLASG
ncbi:mitochondrial fission 1 protein A-like [Setaria italica]|uniref:mitochondrial fission 1 protein A-like n=1 Tax=Setaria italica TaxID=4555 RepID=UPI0003513A15|nr:mitochondrial fission 1 protein A-like [Setaria italica]